MEGAQYSREGRTCGGSTPATTAPPPTYSTSPHRSETTPFEGAARIGIPCGHDSGSVTEFEPATQRRGDGPSIELELPDQRGDGIVPPRVAP